MFSRGYRRYVTLLLMTVYVFNQVDRALFGFLMEPIKRELHLSDDQLGFLAGPALVLMYAVLGIPVARWADRSNRVTIMSVAILLWSAIVTLSATVRTVSQLALARVGVGIGEAGFAAIAQSLIGDYHTAAERTRALSVFMLALPLGLAASNLLGGWVNEFYGWRPAFVAAGIPGLLLALMLKWTVREPSRGTRASMLTAAAAQPSLRAVLKMLWRRRALLHWAIAMTLLNIVTASVHTWIPAFFIRNYGMRTGELGTGIAVITVIAAGSGAWLSAHLNNLARTANIGAQARLLSTTAALLCPMLVVPLFWPSARGALLGLFPAYVLTYFLLGPTWSLLQGLCTVNTRATVIAVVIFSQTALAGVVGVQGVGLVSSVLGRGAGNGPSLRAALALFSGGALWAAAHLWFAARSIQRESSELDPETGAGEWA